VPRGDGVAWGEPERLGHGKRPNYLGSGVIT